MGIIRLIFVDFPLFLGIFVILPEAQNGVLATISKKTFQIRGKFFYIPWFRREPRVDEFVAEQGSSVLQKTWVESFVHSSNSWCCGVKMRETNTLAEAIPQFGTLQGGLPARSPDFP